MPRSEISLSAIYRLGLVLLLDLFGRWTYKGPLSVSTRNGHYTSTISFTCVHSLDAADIILGVGWTSTCSVEFRDDQSGLEDPSHTVILSLPAGHYWRLNYGVSVAR